jgi:hypothetical protein
MLLRALLAAAIGTVFMNLSSETEMGWRQRPASTAPGRATNRVLRLVGVPTLEGRSLQILSTWSHYLYGTLWGLYFWMLMSTDALALPIAVGLPLFFLGVWAIEQIELPLLGVAPWSWKWGTREVLIDLWHHAVYASGTMIAWVLIGAVVSWTG